MKQDANTRRMAAGRYASAVLSLLSVYLTCAAQGIVPLPAFIRPLLVQMLLLPAMLLAASGLNWRCFRRGVRALLHGRPDRDSCVVLAAVLAAGLCALGASSGTAGCAVLLLTMYSWMDALEDPFALPSGSGWFYGIFAAAVCAAVFWIIRGNSVGHILERVLSLLAAASVCPFRLLAGLCSARAKRALPVSCDNLQTVSALGTADTAVIIPDGLLTGAPNVSDIRPAGMDEAGFLSLAASILQGCGAPDAACIASLAQSRSLALQDASEREALPDGGWRAVIGGRQYFAGTQEQLQRSGIFAPHADELALSGKTSVCFGMEGGMYLGRIALEHPVCPDAQDAMRALASQRLRLVLPCGEQPLYTRQLAARFGADVSESADTLGQLRREGSPVLLISGEPQAKMQEQLPVLSLRTLADAPVCLRQCRHAVHAGRLLTGFSAALLVLLAGLAGGVFSPALDFGDRPLLCALLSLFITAVSALLACIAVPSAPARHPEEEPTQPVQPKPEAVSAEASTTVLRMDELPAVSGKIALEQALLDVPGVLTAEANYETGIILVTGTADKETLLRAIAEAVSAKEGNQ